MRKTKKNSYTSKLRISLLISIILFKPFAFANQNYADYSTLSPAKIRDTVHNLDLNKEDELKFYYKYLLYFIEENEGFRPYAEEIYSNEYKDNQEPKLVKKLIIGYGFNMNHPKAQSIWDEVFRGKISFDTAFKRQIKLNEEQAEELLMVQVRQCEHELSIIYKPYWEKFKPNERLSLTDIYFFSGAHYIGKRTKIYENMIKYYETSDVKFLHAVRYEIRKIPE